MTLVYFLLYAFSFRTDFWRSVPGRTRSGLSSGGGGLVWKWRPPTQISTGHLVCTTSTISPTQASHQEVWTANLPVPKRLSWCCCIDKVQYIWCFASSALTAYCILHISTEYCNSDAFFPWQRLHSFLENFFFICQMSQFLHRSKWWWPGQALQPRISFIWVSDQAL